MSHDRHFFFPRRKILRLAGSEESIISHVPLNSGFGANASPKECFSRREVYKWCNFGHDSVSKWHIELFKTMDVYEPHEPPPNVNDILAQVYAFEESLLTNEEKETDKADKISPFKLKKSQISYLNHGGFGYSVCSTLELRNFFTDLCYRYSTPMVYHRALVPKLVARARESACEFLGIPEYQRQGFAFTSISSALFTVLDSVVLFDRNDDKEAILVSDTIYHSVADMILHLSKTKGFEIIYVETPHGANMEEIYSSWAQSLENSVARKLKIKLAVFDHISSKPTIMYPVKKICDLCQSFRIPTLVDGAHVPGGIPIFDDVSVPYFGATFYVVTFHKWCNAPRGGNNGGIWVNQTQVEDIYGDFVDVSRVVVRGGSAEDHDHDLYLDASKPGYLTDGLTRGIYDESTREYESIMVLPHCLKLVKSGQADFETHKSNLREETIEILRQAWTLDEKEATRWGDGIGRVSESHQYLLPMICIPLPTFELCRATAARFQSEATEGVNSVKHHLAWLKKYLVLTLWQRHAIEVPVFVFQNKILGVRISFGPRVVIQDIHRLGSAVNHFIKDETELEGTHGV